jgi:GAF domain-containing protein
MFGAAYGLSPAYRAKGPVNLAQSQLDGLALQSGRTIWVEDARSDPRFQYPDEARDEGIISVLVAPLKVQDQPIGVLRVYTSEPREFTAEERELAEAIASLSALAIENGRLYERLNRNYLAALEFNQREFD